MITEITSVELKKNLIILTGTDLEEIFNRKDIYSDEPEKQIKFVFDTKNVGHSKYLWKILQSNKHTKDEKTLGNKLDKLLGEVIFLSNSFIKK